jgi:hypothetical protein
MPYSLASGFSRALAQAFGADDTDGADFPGLLSKSSLSLAAEEKPVGRSRRAPRWPASQGEVKNEENDLKEKPPTLGGFSKLFPLLVDVGLLDVTSFWRVIGDDDSISRRAGRDDEGDAGHGVLVADVAQ